MVARGIWQGHNIEISVHLSPKYLFTATENLVKVDGKEVARFGGFSLNYHVVSAFDHQGEPAQIEIKTRAGLFLPTYLIQINEQEIMQGYLGIESINTMRIYFGLFGFAYVFPLVYLTFPRLREISFQLYDPIRYIAGTSINAVFGAFFIYFGISLKSLLLKSLHFLTTVLYIHIGFMIATTPFLISRLIQETSTNIIDWRIGIFLRLMYIWLPGYFLINCKRLSQELKAQEK